MTADLYHRIHDADAIARLVDRSDEDVLVALEGRPALLRLAGTAPGPRRGRLISCLLHGNEDSGYRATLDLLRSGPDLEGDLWVFIGNVRAASQAGWFAHRHLDDQEDFNRVWGLNAPTTRMRRCADEVLAELVSDADLAWAVDLHNNTGANPFYSVLPRPTPEGLHLAALCAPTVLLWPLAAHTLMEALLDTCPAVALEAGLPRTPAHTAYVRQVLGKLAAEGELTGAQRPEHTLAIEVRLTVRPEVSFAVGGPLTDDVDLVLAPGIEAHNFGVLEAGSTLGEALAGSAVNPLLATDVSGRDVTAEHLVLDDDGRITLRNDSTPVMWTAEPRQIRRDCLGYFASRR